MKGQTLFIRPIEANDGEAIGAFLARNSTSRPVPSCGLLGKVVGELVAVLSMEIVDDGVRIDDLVVDKELRRKRIGSFMIREVETIARKMDREWIIAEQREDASEFLRRVGFTDGRKRVGQ